ncbi:MAG: autotransporter outer membrane beta-barrel domain-containing protein [Phyllobacteriaceae bacterium]|nr:autotransporter outer membrane beta-barrel domain-containing protein [Phyllobacteriaceae bacterium]
MNLRGFYDVTGVIEDGPAQSDSYYTDTGFSLEFSVNQSAGGRQLGTYRFNMPGGNILPEATVTAPTANAGPDQPAVASGATVTLNGSGSHDPDAGTTLTYAWTQTSGTPTVALSSSSAVQPTFVAPVLARSDTAKTFVFQLAVSDGGTPVTDSVSITVLPPAKLAQVISFTSPGNQPFVANSTVALTASSTAPSATVNDPAPTTSLVLTSTTTPVCTVSGTTLTMVSIGTCTITATKLGDADYTDATPVAHTFRLLGENRKPVANAGPNQVVPSPGGNIVVLDGSASSDPDGDSFTYAWTQKSGPSVTLGTGISPSERFFVPPAVALGAPDDVYVFELVVTDEFNLASDASTVSITIQTLPKRNQRIFLTTDAPTNPTVSQTWTPGAIANYDVLTNNLLESFPSGLPVTITIGSGSTAVCSEASGVVTFNAAGICSVEFSQAGNGSYDAAQTVGRTITVVAPQPTVTMTPDNGAVRNGTVGVPFAVQITATLAPNDGYTVSYALTSGSLPAGLALNAESGLISGTPSSAANTNVAVTSTFIKGVVEISGPTYTYTINIGAAEITVSPSGTPPGAVRVNQPFLASFSVAGGVQRSDGAPYTAQLVECKIPNGAIQPPVGQVTYANLNFTAEIAASTLQTGNYCFRVEFEDFVGVKSRSDDIQFTVLDAAPSMQISNYTAPRLLSGDTQTLEATMVVSGGVPFGDESEPYESSTKECKNGIFPNRSTSILFANGITKVSWSISELSAGDYCFRARFDDAEGGAVQQEITFTIGTLIDDPVATMTPPAGALPNGTVGQQYTQNFVATFSGISGSNIYAVTGTLPAGLALGADGVLSGAPTVAGDYSFSVIATRQTEPEGQIASENNASGSGLAGENSITQAYTLKIVAPDVVPPEEPKIPEESEEIAEIQVEGSQASATLSGELITETVGDAVGDAFSDAPGSSPLIGYSNGGMMILSQAKLTPAAKAIDALTAADRKAVRLRAGGSLPGLFYGEGDGAAAADAVEPSRWSIWGSVRGSQLETGAALNNLDGSQYNLLAGASYRWSPELVVGAFTGFETFSYADDVGASLKGQGYTAGAYVGYRPTAMNLRFDAQLSSTWLGYDAASGIVTGSFDATRIIASAGVTGNFTAASVLFEPSVRVTGSWEEQSAYVDSALAARAARSFHFGKVSAGVKASKNFVISPTSSIAPYAGLFAEYRFSGGDTSAASDVFDDFSARATLGFNAKLNASTQLGLDGEISGLGLDDALIYSLKARLGVAF